MMPKAAGWSFHRAPRSAGNREPQTRGDGRFPTVSVCTGMEIPGRGDVTALAVPSVGWQMPFTVGQG